MNCVLWDLVYYEYGFQRIRVDFLTTTCGIGINTVYVLGLGLW